MADDASVEDLRLTYPYFRTAEPLRWQDEGTYATAARLENDTTYEFSHSLGDITSAIIAAGLHLEFLHEFPFCAWQRLPTMVKSEDGYWRLPGGETLVPFLFSLRASKPA
jgi:hypothetical protein